MKLEAKDVLPNINRMQGQKMLFFVSLLTLTFELDLQTHLSEEPNTSSV